MSVGEYYLVLSLALGIPCIALILWIKHQDKKP